MKKAPPQWLVIARREFLERVRSKWFVAVTVLGPIAMVAMIVIPAYLTARSAEEAIRIVVVDETSTGAEKDGQGVGAEFARATHAVDAKFINVEVAAPDTTDKELLARIRNDEIAGFLRIPKNAVDSALPVTAKYIGNNTTNLNLRMKMTLVLNYAVKGVRARAEGVPEERLASFLMPVLVDAEDSEKGTSGAALFIVGYAAMFILYMAIILYAVNVLRSVVEEKTSRVVEIMVSAAKPRSLMLGKVLGVGSVGLFQLSVWAAMALLMVKFHAQLLGFFGLPTEGIAIPELGLVEITVILSYFLLGFFFYASLYAAIGAMVNSDQEAQQAQTPVVILLIIPVLCVQLVANDPRGAASELLTMIPLSSPVLMPMRFVLGGASGTEVALSLAILAVSMACVVWVAGRIYRVGILMYGKRPSLGELIRWIRYS